MGKRISTVKPWNLSQGLKIQTVFFSIIFMIMKRHTCKLFKHILNYVETKDNGEIITA